MVIKADTCFFTEMKIFPGHGHRFVRKDGKLLAFIHSKARQLYTNRKKAQRLRWTQAWRRAHKKGTVEQEAKKRVKRTTKVFKAIAGLSIDDINKQRKQKPDMRKAQREAALREVKEKNRQAKEAKKKAAGGKKPAKGPAAAPKTAAFVKTPKSRKTMGAAARR